MKAQIVMAMVGMVLLTGCSVRSNDNEFASSMFQAPPVDFEMRGTTKGLQAFGDTLNGLITNGKASADANDTPYYEHRRKQEVEETTRSLKDRLLDAWNRAKAQMHNAQQGNGSIPPKGADQGAVGATE